MRDRTLLVAALALVLAYPAAADGGSSPAGPRASASGGFVPAMLLRLSCGTNGSVAARMVGRGQDQVRHVDFVVGRKVLFRDRRRPFARTFERRRISRRANQMQAIMQLRDGRRTAVARSFPRCFR
jgi:hypothetical protein